MTTHMALPLFADSFRAAEYSVRHSGGSAASAEQANRNEKMKTRMGCPWGDSAGPRVGLLVTRLQPLGRYVRVDLRGREALVAEQFLHTADVSPGVEHVSCEAVPQRVRAGPRIESGLGEVFFQQPGDAAGGEPAAILVEK